MSLAAATRSAAREHPFLIEALRAGVVNYAAAARLLDVEGDPETIATALRRFAEELPDRTLEDRRVRVRMRRGIDASSVETLLSIAEGVHPDGEYTAIIVSGEIDATGLAATLDRLTIANVRPTAAGVLGDRAVIIVESADGPEALRLVEAALAAVPTRTDRITFDGE